MARNKVDRNQWFSALVSIGLFTVSAIVSYVIVKYVIVAVQNLIFIKQGVVLVTTTLGIWYLAPWFLSTILLTILLACLLPPKWVRRTSLKKNKGDQRFIFVFAMVTLLIYTISLLNYCIITRNGVFVRDFSSNFVERFYDLEQVGSVEIKSYRQSRGGCNFQYLIEVGSYNINLMNSDDLNKIRQVHLLMKQTNIPVLKHISYIDESKKEILKYIETGQGK